MIEDAWRLLNSTNEWVRFADAKAGGALAGAGVLAGALATAGLSDKFDTAPGAAVWFGVLAGVAALVAAALSVYALLPTLRVGEPVSLIYFEHVARRYRADTDGHAEAVKELLSDEDRYFKEVAAQVWANSVVARGKFLASTWALTALGVGVFLGGIAALITLI
ncbi:DUF5706 domain-containing protein [Microbacterium profundi]|uniref:Pycsar system effector family protein n=1 Tax=Microbacterium profundi TaxID=450380 RepID=UPI001F48633D|nr:Pycsar system effector family protein [Microbacterium profundi]MCE7480874.1 DUF5706 domain-containing protein [Microbacterium profundi]